MNKKKYESELKKEIVALKKGFEEYLKNKPKYVHRWQLLDSFCEYLVTLGYESSPIGSSQYIYIGKKFVVKDSYIKGKKPKTNTIPEIRFIFTDKRSDLRFSMKIQPRCLVGEKSSKSAFKQLKYMEEKHWRDAHSRNVGLLDGTPVIFDW